MDSGLNPDDTMVLDSVDPTLGDDANEDVAMITPDGAAVSDEQPLVRANDEELFWKTFLPPMPGTEAAAEKVWSFEIKDWNTHNQRSHSPTFECGGFPWRVLYYPFGNGTDHASFYLDQGFEGEPPEDWYACVQFALVLWNPNDPTIMVTQTAHHRFTAEESDWGFKQFTELKDLKSRTAKRPRPLVENENAVLSVYMRIIKDPTGVLWHNFHKYDSKKSTGYVGLKNQGATCYLNSLLQSLYFTNLFRKWVYQIPTDNEPVSNSALALQRLFYLLQTSDQTVDTMELTKSFGWDNSDVFTQQDIQELNRILMDNLETRMKGTAVEGFLSKLFVGKTKTYIRCVNVEYASERIEDFWDLQLNVRGCKNLDESFKNYIEVEMMDGENQYMAEGHGLQDAKKGVLFESFPDVLHLHLKRFEYNLSTYSMQKVNDHYEFPEVFDVSPYLDPDLMNAEPQEYVLHGVLVHQGDLNAGHYYSFLKPEKDGEFFKFDDDRVTRATKYDTIEDNFGGEYNEAQIRNYNIRTLSRNRSNNAYMLIYLRKSKIDDILVPVTEEDTPYHLKQRFLDEAAEAERIRKEREEQHLYLQVAAVTESQFQRYQGFDLTKWGDVDMPEETKPWIIKFKRAATIQELQEHLGKRMDLDWSQIRLWIMVNRQNKTVRPDQVLSDLDMTCEDAVAKYSSTSTMLRIFVETIDKGDIPRSPSTPYILLLLKMFDPEKQTLLGFGHCFVRTNDRISELYPIIYQKTGWSHKTDIWLFEEIKPNLIEPMKDSTSFHASEMQDGDIVCFQKAVHSKEYATTTSSSSSSDLTTSSSTSSLSKLTSRLTSIPISTHRAKHLESSKLIRDARQFYEHLNNLTRIYFRPKVITTSSHDPSSLPSFDLELSKRMTYEDVSSRVAERVGINPDHLRFHAINAQTGNIRIAVKRTAGMTLQQMLTSGTYYSTPSNAMCYEVLSMSLAELETKKAVKIVFLPDGISKEEVIEVLVPKMGTLEDAVEGIVKKANIKEGDIEKLRFFQAHAGRWVKELPRTFGVTGLQDYMNTFCEVTPEEEWALREPGEAGGLESAKVEQIVKEGGEKKEEVRWIEAFHFMKEPSKVHVTGVPFKFIVRKGEKFADTRIRLQKRTGIKKKLFENIKFAVVKHGPMYSKPVYLDDEDELAKVASSEEDLLGLDHADKNGRNGWGRSGGGEIKIR